MIGLLDALQELTPQAMIAHEPALGCFTVAPAPDGGLQINSWACTAPRPTPGELTDWVARQVMRKDLRDTQAMLDERYRLYNRAGATGNLAAQAEIKGEITDLLTYMKELRDATDPA